MDESAYKIKLPLFEGPMDLLLHLIREHKLDIYDIPISLITRQYLEYLELMKELNLEVAGEFLVMAATLIHIKSRMLLPLEDTADTDEPEDPRLELVMRLLEYKAFREAAHGLKELEDDQSEVFTRSSTEFEDEDEEVEELSLFDLNLFDLITSFQKMIDRAPAEAQTLTRETLTVKDKMSVIIESLQSREAMRFADLFKDDIIKAHFVITFVAMLELIRLGIAKVYQDEQFGEVWIINPETDRSKDDIIREKIYAGQEPPKNDDNETEEQPELNDDLHHPYDEEYEYEEGHPYKKSKPFQKYRQYEGSHPYGDSALEGFKDKDEAEKPAQEQPIEDDPIKEQAHEDNNAPTEDDPKEDASDE